MKLRLIMADPAGNRTAIVRTPVPAELRAKTAAEIMKIQELRAEQVGFETAPRMGGAGRLEMMGGEFCGNAARSFGFLCFSERRAMSSRGCADSSSALLAGRPDGESTFLAGRPYKESAFLAGRPYKDSALLAGVHGCGAPVSAAPEYRDILIEISGSTGLLRVSCNPEKGTAFSEMPMPQRMDFSEEGFPLIISEGIAHMILVDMEPDPGLIHQMVERYGSKFDAFGLQFLKGDTLIPVVYVEGSGSMVYESSCGSGSLAAAWYLEQVSDRIQEPKNGKPRKESFDGTDNGRTYRFREPGGEIVVRLIRDDDGDMHGTMGGSICLEKEILLSIPMEV